MTKTYKYKTMEKVETYTGDDPLTAIANNFYSKEQIVNGNQMLTAQKSNGIIKVREITAGNLTTGSLTLSETQTELDADEISTVDFYQQKEEEA